MCNDPSPETYLAKRMLSLNDIVVALFDNVEENNHQCTIHNLYNPAAFFKAVDNHEKKY